MRQRSRPYWLLGSLMPDEIQNSDGQNTRCCGRAAGAVLPQASPRPRPRSRRTSSECSPTVSAGAHSQSTTALPRPLSPYATTTDWHAARGGGELCRFGVGVWGFNPKPEYAWDDTSNNRAFLSGRISATNNGASISIEAKRKPDSYQTEKGAPLWLDILHARDNLLLCSAMSH